ncbi:MAG: nucleoside deaminase [bacterium]|nr:nucleoside deaminase [bacterium]
MPNYFDRGMYRALRQAEEALRSGEVPVGAVVMHGERLLGTGSNRTMMSNDPTAHAEMLAISAATQTLGEQYLEGCTLFVTLEPCPMCAGAILLARLDRVVFGANDPKMGAAGSLYNLLEEGKLPKKTTVVGGICEQECGDILRRFFQERRN